MGQKVNPHGLRVGVIKGWDSRWFSETDFADNLAEDHKIRKFLKKKLYSAGIGRIQKKVRGHAGVYGAVLRTQLVVSLPVFPERQAIIAGLRNDRRIPADAFIPSVYVAIGTSGAYPAAAVPRIPNWHDSVLPARKPASDQRKIRSCNSFQSPIAYAPSACVGTMGSSFLSPSMCPR